jgi:hypothetical protein
VLYRRAIVVACLAPVAFALGVCSDNIYRQARPLLLRDSTSAADRLEIYVGLNDGHAGSVPISHALRFFNKPVDAYAEPAYRVSELGLTRLLTRDIADDARSQRIEDRQVLYSREIPTASITVFEGGHEMLPRACFD